MQFGIIPPERPFIATDGLRRGRVDRVVRAMAFPIRTMVGEKFESYVAIMEALHDIAAGFDEELEPGDISSARKVELREQYRSGKKAVYKQIDIGRFLLDGDTVSALQKC